MLQWSMAEDGERGDRGLPLRLSEAACVPRLGVGDDTLPLQQQLPKVLAALLGAGKDVRRSVKRRAGRREESAARASGMWGG